VREKLSFYLELKYFYPPIVPRESACGHLGGYVHGLLIVKDASIAGFQNCSRDGKWLLNSARRLFWLLRDYPAYRRFQAVAIYYGEA
jgi:hypothetical protein